MIIGVPREVKDHESRVGVTPAGVKALVEAGHEVLVEQRAGALSAMPDDEYQAAGAEIVGVRGLASTVMAATSASTESPIVAPDGTSYVNQK